MILGESNTVRVLQEIWSESKIVTSIAIGIIWAGDNYGKNQFHDDGQCCY